MNINHNNIIIGVVAGAIFGAFLGSLDVSGSLEAIIILAIMFAIVGGGVVMLFYRRGRLKPQPVTRATQTRFTLTLLAGCIFSLILGNLIFAAILGIATIGAWYSLQEMSDQ